MVNSNLHYFFLVALENSFFLSGPAQPPPAQRLDSEKYCPGLT